MLFKINSFVVSLINALVATSVVISISTGTGQYLEVNALVSVVSTNCVLAGSVVMSQIYWEFS